MPLASGFIVKAILFLAKEKINQDYTHISIYIHIYINQANNDIELISIKDIWRMD